MFGKVDKCVLSVIEKNYPFSQINRLSPKVTAAFQFMEENFNEWTPEGKEITLQHVAVNVGMHPASLCKKIHKELGRNRIYVTCTDYLDGLRVLKAKEHFQSNPHLLCLQVANRVGTGERNFRKIFKSFTGITPSEYRFQGILGKDCSDILK